MNNTFESVPSLRCLKCNSAVMAARAVMKAGGNWGCSNKACKRYGMIIRNKEAKP